jgi:hypothetical protein
MQNTSILEILSIVFIIQAEALLKLGTIALCRRVSGCGQDWVAAYKPSGRQASNHLNLTI